MRRLAILGGATLAVAAAGVWAATSFQPCRALDRLLGRSGCVRALTISDLASLRQTALFHPKAPRTLIVAGVSYRTGYGEKFQANARLVAVDAGAGAELWRRQIYPNGVIERLVLSADGATAAFTCNRLFSCDFARGDVPAGMDPRRALPVSVVDLAAIAASNNTGDTSRAQFKRFVAGGSVAPEADGRGPQVAFSANGAAILAGDDAWTVTGEPLEARPPAAFDARGVDAVETPDGLRVAYDRRAQSLEVTEARAGRRAIQLDLPKDFWPELRLPLVLSPDGARVAALSRRFSGPGAPRAVLQVWRLSDGARLARYDLVEDVYETLLFTPDGVEVVVARAPAPEPRAATELRFYRAGAGA